jgi:hypothetical protein
MAAGERAEGNTRHESEPGELVHVRAHILTGRAEQDYYQESGGQFGHHPRDANQQDDDANVRESLTWGEVLKQKRVGLFSKYRGYGRCHRPGERNTHRR